MKTILCFGDSNTWGYNPATKERFGRDERWTGVLREGLDQGYLVIEEGLNGRTTVWNDPIEGYKNGKKYLIPCLQTHKPIDLVVLMLGTNDLKKRFSLSASDIARGAGVLVNEIKMSDSGIGGKAPKILLMCPPPVAKLNEFGEMFEGSEEKSKGFSKHYREIAKLYGCDFLDVGEVIKSSDIDGIHFEVEEHEKLGKTVAEVVRKIFE